MITITPVRDEFAGEVFGIDCARPLTADAVDAIKDGMDRYAKPAGLPRAGPD